MTPFDVEKIRGADAADVYKAGRLAAKLRRRAGLIEFSYLPEYLGDGTPVATTLPLTDQPRVTAAGAVPPFFAGLLPEGRRLTNLRRAVKTSADDELTLLLAVGRDPIGDVQVVPEGEAPSAAEAVISVEGSFENVRFADLLAEAGIVDPVALPGVQDKVSARVISMPLGRASNRYILKINPPEYPHVVENEAYFLGVAERMKMPVTEAAVVHDADGRPGLLVTRFDRIGGADGVTVPLACEDACQLLDRWPADKYQVTSEEVVDVIGDRCAASLLARREVLRQLCFAWVTGNGDVQAKNLSILQQPGGEWRLAPAYDLPATVPYGDKSLALPLRGKTTGLSRRRFLEFAAAIGLPAPAAIRVIDEVLTGTESVIADLEAGVLPFAGQALRETVGELRDRRRQMVAA
jgi:serine/threonine-protein kinase HipA